MTVYKLYSTSVADSDSVATVDVPVPGNIVGIEYSWSLVGPAGGLCSGQLELSFASSNGLAVNDTKSSIATFSYASTSASANATAANNHYVSVPGIPIAAGERIHLHNLVDTAPASAKHYIYLYVDDKATTARARRL